MLLAMDLCQNFKNPRGAELEHRLVYATPNVADLLLCPQMELQLCGSFGVGLQLVLKLSLFTSDVAWISRPAQATLAGSTTGRYAPVILTIMPLLPPHLFLDVHAHRCIAYSKQRNTNSLSQITH